MVILGIGVNAFYKPNLGNHFYLRQNLEDSRGVLNAVNPCVDEKCSYMVRDSKPHTTSCHSEMIQCVAVMVCVLYPVYEESCGHICEPLLYDKKNWMGLNLPLWFSQVLSVFIQ